MKFMNPDDLLELMKGRRSIRMFESDPVPDDSIAKILNAAQFCQSGSNRQPWRFIVIKNKKLIEDLSKTTSYGKFVKDVSVVIAIVANKESAPKWYIHDTSMASHQICLMTWALGLGTCWIGTMDRVAAGNLLNLSEDEHLTTILPIGVPKNIPNPTPRKKIEEIVTYIN